MVRDVLGVFMLEATLGLGAVYKPNWDDRLIRVLAFDENTVIYDCWVPHKNEWSLTSLKGTVFYYRLARPRIISDAAYIRTEPLSKEELDIHRPDIPLSFLQAGSVQWSELQLNDIDTAAARLAAIDPRLALQVINAPAIFLLPFGKKGRVLPGVKINAKNGATFSAAELLFYAGQIQQPSLSGDSIANGIGIYRAGIQKCLPSFYIWGAEKR